jgi:hypothetical protein
MSYKANVFNVMIASPDDVSAVRAIIREALAEWNAIHSSRRKMVLLPIGWDSHSSPEMGRTPQEIVNSQVLTNSDLLVGVFWTRIGTKTAEYASGSVEEIERHIESGRPAMLYFSTQPAHPDSFDADQYRELKKFRHSCQQRCLYETFDSHSNFKEQFFRQLQMKTNDHPMFSSVTDEERSVSSEVVESAFRIPELSHEARVLLKEASQDDHGHIMFMRFMGGSALQTNGKNLIEDRSRRSVAMWEAALDELVAEALLVERGSKGEAFEVTALGFQVADMVQL